MKKLLGIIAVTVLAGVVVTGLNAYVDEPVVVEDSEAEFIPAQADQDRPMMRRGGFNRESIAEELNLTDEQKDQLEKMRFEHQKEMIAATSDVKILGLEIKELMKERGNDQAVLAKHAEMQNVISQISEMRIRHKLEMRAVLTDEQWELFDDMRGFERGFRGQRGFDARGGRGDGFRASQRGFRGMGRGFGGGYQFNQDSE